jgi:hypothetical protein
MQLTVNRHHTPSAPFWRQEKRSATAARHLVSPSKRDERQSIFLACKEFESATTVLAYDLTARALRKVAAVQRATSYNNQFRDVGMLNFVENSSRNYIQTYARE